MARRNSLACILLLLGLVYSVIASSAAVLELKTGQKIEGDYVGGSATEIKLKVGSQVLVFPVQDVSRLHFVAAVPEGDFSGDSLKAVRVLKGLQSVTKVGVNLREYSRRINDAAIDIDAFLDKYKGGHGELLTEMREAMALYSLALSAWNASVTVDVVSVTEQHLQMCPALQEGNNILHLSLPDRRTLWRGSVQPLWSCADAHITKLEELVQPK